MKAILTRWFSDKRSEKAKWVESFSLLAWSIAILSFLMIIPVYVAIDTGKVLWPTPELQSWERHPRPFFIGAVLLICILIMFVFSFLFIKLERKLGQHYDEDAKWGPPPQE
jgi:MFS family permease